MITYLLSENLSSLTSLSAAVTVCGPKVILHHLQQPTLFHCSMSSSGRVSPLMHATVPELSLPELYSKNLSQFRILRFKNAHQNLPFLRLVY